MATFEMRTLDLEHGGATTSGNDHGEQEDDDGGSCCSQFYDCCISDSEILEVGSRRASSDFSVIEMDPEDTGVSRLTQKRGNGVCQIKVALEGNERDCRICHMGLESTSGENGAAIQLGCSCKDDLAAAHKNCAETWFKIKGNKTCEICNSIASNVVGLSNSETSNVVCLSNSETMQQTNQMHSVVSSHATGQLTSASETRRFLNSHRFINFLLSCMVFAFVISWLFHFDITS